MQLFVMMVILFLDLIVSFFLVYKIIWLVTVCLCFTTGGQYFELLQQYGADQEETDNVSLKNILI